MSETQAPPHRAFCLRGLPDKPTHIVALTALQGSSLATYPFRAFSPVFGHPHWWAPGITPGSPQLASSRAIWPDLGAAITQAEGKGGLSSESCPLPFDKRHLDKQTTTWTLDTQVPQQELFDIFDISPRSQNRSGPGSFTQAATQMALRRSIVRYCIPGHASPLLCPNSRNHLNKSPSAKQSSRVIIRCTLSRPMSI